MNWLKKMVGGKAPSQHETSFFNLFSITICCLLLISCRDNSVFLGDGYNPPPPPIIPTTKIKGPGGPAYMAGDFRDYLRRVTPSTNIHLYIMNQSDYNDTILHAYINSTDASFIITELPLDTVDLIFTSDKYLCAKVAPFILDSNKNSFNNTYSSGFFIDSTVYLISIADSVERLNAPKEGIVGYTPTIIVKIKHYIPDSVSWNIIQAFPYDTVVVYHFHDPVFDPELGDVYDVIYDHDSNYFNKERLIYFNFRKEVRHSGPGILVISP